MPSAKIDLFWEGLDFFNITYSKSEGAPKVTAPWKIRTAPKLPPKPKALPASSTPRPEPRATINSTRFRSSSEEKDTPRIEDVTETEPEKPATAAPKKNIPKLKDTAKTKDAAKTREAQKAEAGPSNASKVVPKSGTTAPKKNIPKLKDTAANKPKTASKAANTSKPLNTATQPQAIAAQ